MRFWEHFWVIAIIVVLAGLSIRFCVYRHFARSAKRFPREWDEMLRRLFSWYRLLPSAYRLRLQSCMIRFMTEKSFEGAAGLVITEEMRIVISAFASLLAAGRKGRPYPRLASVVLYPDVFSVPSYHEFSPGHYLEAIEVRAGESWRTGAVVLAWSEVEANLCGHTNRNVVLHEFAHQLDMENGVADGIPLLQSVKDYAPWARSMRTALERARARKQLGELTAVPEYGLSHEAEFFAVLTELFFEQPEAMKQEFADVYRQFVRFYGVDPVILKEEETGKNHA